MWYSVLSYLSISRRDINCYYVRNLNMSTTAARQCSVIFDNVPKHNYLGLLDDSSPKKVASYLGLTTSELSKAVGVTTKRTTKRTSSRTHSEKIPKEILARMREIAVICEMVAGYFEGNVQKTVLWFSLKNPMLGGISPKDMIRSGNYRKLEKFIRNALDGNTV